MKKFWVTVSSTLLFLFLFALPALAQYPPGRGGGGGGDGDGFDPGAGGGLGGGGAGGGGDGLADTGGRFTLGMVILIVSLAIIGTALVLASRRRTLVLDEDS